MPGAAGLIAPALPWAELLVALPMAGLLTGALGRRGDVLVAILAPIILVLAVLLVGQVAWHGPVSRVIGGWAPPLGIELRADGLSAALVLTTAIIASASMVYALPKFAMGQQRNRSSYVFWPLVFTLWCGLNAIFLSGDLFNIYVALELLTLSAVALVSISGRAEALTAAMRYLFFGLLGSLAYLAGVALLYTELATLDLTRLRAAAEPGAATLVAMALMTAGLFAKTAVFPLHAWLPAAHVAAPAPASALLSGLVIKASFYVIVRVWFDVLPGAVTFAAAQGIGVFGTGAVIFGSLMAIRQPQLKPIIAYSTVAQVGYLFLMFPLAGGTSVASPWVAGAWTGGILHALSHAFAKAAMFLAAGVMIEKLGHDRLDGLAGISRTLPMSAFAFGLAGLSIMGLPPSGGFTAKYLLLTSAIASGQWWWVVVLMMGGLLAAVYVFRPLGRMFTPAREDGGAKARTDKAAPRWQQVIALALAGISVLLGIGSLWPYALLQIGRPMTAAEGL